MKNAATGLLSLFCILLFASVSVSAQKIAVFGGYQLTHVGGERTVVVPLSPFGGSSGANINGWNASLTGAVAPLLGITADFSGAYTSGSSKVHTYTFGPEVRLHLKGVRPFAHALFGGWTSSGPVSLGATNRFAMLYGGGLDVKAKPAVSLRLAQFDWMVTRLGKIDNSFSTNSFRYSAGVVFSF